MKKVYPERTAQLLKGSLSCEDGAKRRERERGRKRKEKEKEKEKRRRRKPQRRAEEHTAG